MEAPRRPSHKPDEFPNWVLHWVIILRQTHIFRSPFPPATGKMRGVMAARWQSGQKPVPERSQSELPRSHGATAQCPEHSKGRGVQETWWVGVSVPRGSHKLKKTSLRDLAPDEAADGAERVQALASGQMRGAVPSATSSHGYEQPPTRTADAVSGTTVRSSLQQQRGLTAQLGAGPRELLKDSTHAISLHPPWLQGCSAAGRGEISGCWASK